MKYVKVYSYIKKLIYNNIRLQIVLINTEFFFLFKLMVIFLIDIKTYFLI